MPVFKDEKRGTWYVMARYCDWTGTRRQKCKRGFPTKRDAQDWEHGFKLQTCSDLDMTFEAFVELYTKDKKEKRTDLTATLDVVGRDQPDQRLHLTRDQDSLVWQLDHAERELWKAPPDPLLEKVAALVTPDVPEWSGSPSELVSVVDTDMAANALTRYLNVNSARLRSDYNIEYGRRLRHEGRRIYLRLLSAGDAAPT